MDWLTGRNKESLQDIRVDGMLESVSQPMSRFCCMYFHQDSPLVQKVKDPVRRMIDAFELGSVNDAVAGMIAQRTPEFLSVVRRWFAEYDNDNVEYYISLTIKIEQLNFILRETLEFGEMTADDKAKTIKMNCDAAKELGDLIDLKRKVEKNLFVDVDARGTAKAALAQSLSPESMSGLNKQP